MMFEADNVREIVREITARAAPAAVRGGYGHWIAPAWAVRMLVDKGWGVTAAVQQVIDTMELEPRRKAFSGVRTQYYKLRGKPWPEGMKDEPEDDI